MDGKEQTPKQNLRSLQNGLLGTQARPKGQGARLRLHGDPRVLGAARATVARLKATERVIALGCIVSMH
jgi:hypothetical protein